MLVGSAGALVSSSAVARWHRRGSVAWAQSGEAGVPLAVAAGLVPEGGKHVSEDVVGLTHSFEVRVKAPLGLQLVESASGGVSVAAVESGLGADRAGCRRGDRVVATSATVGDAMWPKATLAGVESALRSRLRLARWSGEPGTVRLRLERSFAGSEAAMSLLRRAEAVEETWEVELRKPLGLTLQVREGKVTVSGVRKGGSAYDDGRLRRGDVVAAVSGGWGRGGMVECSSVEDVIKAAAQRETVRLRMERTVRVGAFAPVQQERSSVGEDDTTMAAGLARAAERRVALDVGKTIVAYRNLTANRLPATATATLLVERSCALCRTYAQVAKRLPEGDIGRSLAIASLDALLKAVACVPPTAKLVAEAATAYTTVGRPDLAVDIYERTPVEATNRLATAAVSAYRRLGMTESAFDVVASQPEESEVVRAPDAQLCNALLTASARAPRSLRDDGRTERFFAAMRRPNGVHEFFFSLRAAASDMVFFEADAAKNNNDDGAVLANPVSYNIMVDFYARRKLPELAAETVRQMRAVGVIPGRVALTALIKAYAEARRPDEARAAFDALADHLEERGRVKRAELARYPPDEAERRLATIDKSSSPDVEAWNTLVRSYGLVARWREASAVVRDMKAAGVAPNLLTYTNIATAALRAGQYKVALAWLDELDEVYQSALEARERGAAKRRLRLRPNVVAYTMKILAHAKLGDLAGAAHALRRMRDCRVAPNARTFAALLEACVTADQPHAGLALADEMRRVEGVEEDVVIRTLLLKCYFLAGDAAKATALLEDMERAPDRRDRPNLVTYNAALAGFADLGHRDAALEMLRVALKRYTPNKHTWAALVDAKRRARDADFLYDAITAIADANKALALPVYEAWLVVAARYQATDMCDKLARRRAAGDLPLLFASPDDDGRLSRLERAARGYQASGYSDLVGTPSEEDVAADFAALRDYYSPS